MTQKKLILANIYNIFTKTAPNLSKKYKHL